ncbi:sugar transferase, partial [Anaerovibrio lipolyticus]|uniref:sugar transferase n=1 Tax=Anaerovibrio lipolyticus TaxID=82374 RepID=UPI001F1C1CDA
KVFFNDYRIGKSGRTFLCYKFRSMYTDSDRILQEYLEQDDEARQEWEEFQKLRGFDPRVTAVGRFIRKTSLDELPQVINVLLGDMSLVGPRPYLPREKDIIGDYLDIICQVQPGITGIWQVSGRSDVNFAGRLELDEWYVKNRSILIDIKCLLKTAQIVLFGKGAY